MNFSKNIRVATSDFTSCYSNSYLACMLGWQDIKQRYRRSKLGPFWLTISMGVMIGMIGLVFGQVLNTPMQEYLPFLATGIILWTCFSTTIMEGSTAFIDASGMIRQLGLPLSLYPARVLWRNLVILCHNLIILPLVFIFAGKGITWNIIWLIPGLFVLMVNMFWLALLLSVFCTRFRDMPQIVNSLIQVFFYITPVIWMPDSLSARSASLLVDPNPVYHLIQLVRAPILGEAPAGLDWVFGVATGVVGLVISSFLFGLYKKRIAYWL